MALPAPIAYWPFNEGTGTTAADASGNGHVATLSHGTWDTTALKTFGAAALKNTDGGFGASFTAMNLGTVYSIAFWLNGWDGANDGLSLGGMTGNGYATYFNGAGSIYHQVGSGNFTNASLGTATGSHHIAIVRNGTSVTFYKDGVSLGSGTLASNTALSLDTISGYAVGTFPIVGTMDEVRIYDVALSGAQVTELFNLNPDGPSAEVRVTHSVVETLTFPTPAMRVSTVGVEAVVLATIPVRVTQVGMEVLVLPPTQMRISQLGVEVMTVSPSSAEKVSMFFD